MPMMSISNTLGRGREFKPLEGGGWGRLRPCSQALGVRRPAGQARHGGQLVGRDLCELLFKLELPVGFAKGNSSADSQGPW